MSASSRGRTPDYTIQIYEDSGSSDHESGILDLGRTGGSLTSFNKYARHRIVDSHDGSETEVVDEGENEDVDDKELDLVKSIEGGDGVLWTRAEYDVHGKNRNFSSTTAIRFGNQSDDPFVDEGYGHGLDGVFEEEDEADVAGVDADGEYEHDDEDPFGQHSASEQQSDDGAGQVFDTMAVDSRRVSEFSTLPDEMDEPPPEAPSPPAWSRRGLRTTPDSCSSPNRGNRLLSSPQNSSARYFSPSTSNAKDNRFVSSPLARQSPSSAAFRNPSSVRATQLSSPSPPPSPRFTNSPRSARQRRLGINGGGGSSRNGTPSHDQHLRQSARGLSNIDGTPTPSKHPHPQKEYPLVLLHCSFSSLPLPYSASVLRAVLPDDVHDSLALLREKLGLTVLERGMLIPHPGEDYELLEERVLESLELKTPRVGKCGHFIGSNNTSRKSSARNPEEVAAPEANGAVNEHGGSLHPKCETCSRHVADGHRGCEGDNHKRWDIRVYASNGLMRAGAWGAAWREMEKVDIEIGVWLDEDTRAALEHEANAEFERGGDPDDAYHFGYANVPAEDEEFVQLQQQARGEAFIPNARHPIGPAKGAPRSASTAACSRTASRQHVPQRRQRAQDERIPLSTLFFNVVKRTVTARSELLLQFLVLGLAVALFMQWQGQSASPMAAVASMDKENPALVSPLAIPLQHTASVEPEPESSTQVAVTTAPAPAPVLAETESSCSCPVSCPEISACTFPTGDGKEAGMTALPADKARQVLSQATASAPLPENKATTIEEVTSPASTSVEVGTAQRPLQSHHPELVPEKPIAK